MIDLVMIGMAALGGFMTGFVLSETFTFYRLEKAFYPKEVPENTEVLKGRGINGLGQPLGDES